MSNIQLTFPPAEAEYLTDVYSQSNIILEYGSGGSTLLAVQQGHSLVMSVESDKAWAENLQTLIARDNDNSQVESLIHWVDLGPTREWGWPVGDSKWRNWHNYPLSVWSHPRFRQPDLVLIDGRFRIGCFLATLFLTKAPVTILWDDYTDRPHYHCIEKYARPIKTVGRMARFELTPQQFDPASLAEIISLIHAPE